jgi:hypothetical protein
VAFGDGQDQGKRTPKTQNRALRQHAKQNLEKAMEGGLVSDRETRQFEDQSRASADAAIRGQQAQMNEASLAAGQGTVQQANLQEAAAQGAEAAGSAAVKASGQAQSYKEGATMSRKAAAITEAHAQRDEDTARRLRAQQIALGAVDVGGIAVMDLLSLGG